MKILKCFLVFLSFFVASTATAAELITKESYAKMLYFDPRGVACSKCHGKTGERNIIVTYKVYNKKTKEYIEKDLVAPTINDLTFDRFKRGIKEPKSFMPTYFLTDDEIALLYEYIIKFKKGKKK